MMFKTRKKTLGFTMLEVVIAMAVGAVGVIAFAGLQLKSAEISEESRQRAIAVYLATEMMERMMLNAQDNTAKRYYRGEIAGYWTSKYDYAPSYAVLSYEACMNSASVCKDPYYRAIYDIYEMKYLASTMLPNGDMRYRACGPGSKFDCIVVTWEDANPATCGFATDGSGLTDCYILQGLIWF